MEPRGQSGGEEQRRGSLWGGGWIFLCNLPERFKNPGDPAIYLALCYAEPRQRKIDSVTASNPLLRPAPHHYGSTTQTPYRPLRPFPQPMRDDRGGHLGWRVIERKRWVRNLLWGCVLSAPLGLGRKKAKEGADGAWKLRRGSYKGLLALYWSIALPCFALLSWYKVQYPWRGARARYPLWNWVQLIIRRLCSLKHHDIWFLSFTVEESLSRLFNT